MTADTTIYRKCWTLCGHSNGEGLAASSPMYAHHTWLRTTGSAVQPSTQAEANKRIHSGLKMFVSKLPWADFTSTPGFIAEGAWLDMTLDWTNSPNGVHPYSSPYNYPSGRSAPLSPSNYRADGLGQNDPIIRGGGAMTGVELPLSFRLSQYWGESPYGIKLSIPATYFLRNDGVGSTFLTGYPMYSPRAWWSPEDVFDWDPSSGRLYEAMQRKLVGAQAAMPTGEKIDVQVSILWFGDNDANRSPAALTNFKEFYRAWIKKWRHDLKAGGYSTLPENEIRIIIMGLFAGYGTAHPENRTTMLTAMEELADELPYVAFVPTASYSPVGLVSGVLADDVHINDNGYVQAADDILAALKEMDAGVHDALDLDEVITVATAKERVRSFYENNKVRTGATNDDTVLLHLNGALDHILNKIGDLAYWLRQREEIEVTSSSTTNGVITMPKYVKRILRIESVSDPTYPLRFEMVGHADGGALQILMLERQTGTGTFTFQYIQATEPLTADNQIVPLPKLALEWFITEACRRVARSAGHPVLQASLDQDSQLLQADVFRHAGAMQRGRFDRLRTQRQMRGRIGSLRRYRTWY